MKKTAMFLILLAGVLWGGMGVFVRKLNALGLESMEIVSLRAIVTCAFMLVFLLFYNRTLFRIRLKDLWCFLGTGICSIVFFNFCYFKAITLTSLSVAAVLLYTAPAIVMLLSFFLFGEKLTKYKVRAILMTFAGCFLVTGAAGDLGAFLAGTASSRAGPAGLLAGIGAGLGYALYSIFGRYALERGYHSLTITFYTFLIASVGSVLTCDFERVMQRVAVGGGVMFALSLGVFCTVVPYLAYTKGLIYIENSKASVIASVEPVTATLTGVLMFHEKLTLEGILGILLVLGAIAICGKE